MNHIATVLTELIEVIDSEKLLSLAKASHERAWVQRLGYVLEQINPDESIGRDQYVALLKKYSCLCS